MIHFSDKFETLREMVNGSIASAVAKSEPRGLYAPIQYFIDSGGKRLRPILLMLSSEAVGSTAEHALDAAVGVELLHNFTLVHDDIMDHDQTRRGKPTVHAQWGEEAAILAGDSLVALAYRMLLRTRLADIGVIARVFTEGIIDVCEGQALDKEFEARNDVTLDEYLTMIDKKTARLFSTSCELGARIGGGSDEEVAALREYGFWLGRAFQIQDDILDISSPEEISGKTFGSDIKRGKKTYLVIRALQVASFRQRESILSACGKSDAQRDEILAIKDLFEELGVMNEAQDAVASYLAHVASCLDHVRASRAVDYLRELPRRLLARQS